jgi:hypothetical protein
MHTPIKTWLGVLVIIIIALTAGMFIWFQQKNLADVDQSMNNLPVVTTHRACTEEAKLCPDGSYVSRTGPKCEFMPCPEIIGIANKIFISAPSESGTIFSPVVIAGKALGTWFFEGSFPVGVHDANDKLLGTGIAQFVQQSENDTWMTDQLINFQGEIKFSKPATDTGYILFKKDNPSGKPENDESYKLPVKFINTNKFSQSVTDLCGQEEDIYKNCSPDNKCMDGFNSHCYFDSSLYNKNSLKTGMGFPEETKKACFAIHSTSACQCTNKFELKKNGELKEVNCEDFFQAIEDKNNSCNNCIDEIWAGCC